jgi:hypothetical protein
LEGFNMKRVGLMIFIALAVTVAASAQYVVQEVTGRVERDAGGGRWTAVSVGDTLRADAVIRTVIGANLTVKNGDEVFTVGPMKNGALSELVKGGSSIQIQGRVSQTDTSSGGRTSGRISTASARASDAAGDIEIAE